MNNKLSKIISKLYQILLERLAVNTDAIKHKCEKDCSSFSVKTHNCSYNVMHKLFQIKMTRRQYYTPEKLHFFVLALYKAEGSFFSHDVDL